MKKMHVSATIWRTLAILIVLVLASAYLTSYLAARFTSSGGDDDSARVARWDYELTLVDSGKYLLGTEYADLDSNASTPAKVKTNDFTGTLSVKGQSSVVTPNSSGYATFNMTGGAASEVAAKVWVYSASKTPSLKVGDTTYSPILWSLTGHDNTTNTAISFGTDVTDVTLDAVINALNSIGTLPNTDIDRTYTISWYWPLESGNDTADTALMLYAAGYELSGALDLAGYTVPAGAATSAVTDFFIDLSFHIEQIN